ncbi:prickle-like protein 4 isoform X2 [Castor canadensis]
MQSTANMEEGASPLLGPHPPPPLLPEALLGEVATPGPQCGQLILATFHRKPDLRDRAGRKQTLSPMLVPRSGWSHQEDSPISRKPGTPTKEPGTSTNSDSDSSHLPEEDLGDTSAQGPAMLSLGLPRLDTNQTSKWPELRSLLQQLPPQDSDERYCLALGEEELVELRLFCAQRKQKALGQGVACLLPPKLEGHTCEKCRLPLKPGEYGVFAARAGKQRCWHRPCFSCQACGQALINLIYFYHEGHLYCGRHHAELLRPRCPACDQLIFSLRCTEAEGQRWHENHFCCQDCAEPLGGGRYALPGGSPCCPSCFESRYSDGNASPAAALEGQASLGKGGEGTDQRRRGWRLRLGRAEGRPLAPGPRRSIPPAAPRPPTATPRPEHRGPQLSPRVPGRSAPRASGAHPAPRSGLRRRTRSRAGDEASHWWTKAGTGGGPWSGLAAAAQMARGGAGREAEPNPGLSSSRSLCKPGAGLRQAFLTRPGTGESGRHRTEAQDRASLEAGTISRAALPAAAAGSSLGIQSGPPEGREQERLETPHNLTEDASCPTCSSSSDSEPEGFFLGQRLPLAWKTPGNLQADDSDTSRKHCTLC